MAATKEFTVKLLINTRARRVLFAETTRDVVFFLYSLLASPDTAIPFDEETWDGCTSNLAESVQELVDREGEDEDDPPPPPPRRRRQEDPRLFFVCRDKRGAGCDGYVAERSGARCPSCGGRMDAEAPRGAPRASCSRSESEQAVAVAQTTFALMDDLTIGPPPANARAVFTDSVGAAVLQEVTVRLGHEEVRTCCHTSSSSRVHRTHSLMPLHVVFRSCKQGARENARYSNMVTTFFLKLLYIGFGDSGGIDRVEPCPHRCFPPRQGPGGRRLELSSSHALGHLLLMVLLPCPLFGW
jgi:hypothetical protein